MTLQASGQISFSDIRVELGGSAGTTTGLWAAESGGYGAINQCSDPKPTGAQPSSTTEWYSYNHLATSSTYVLGLDPTGGTGSSTNACNAAETGDVNTYYAGVTYYKNNNCLNLIDAGYYAKISTNTWYYFNPAGALDSTGSCGTTTTTTTTTTLTCACNFKTLTCTSGCSNSGFTCSAPQDCFP